MKENNKAEFLLEFHKSTLNNKFTFISSHTFTIKQIVSLSVMFLMSNLKWFLCASFTIIQIIQCDTLPVNKIRRNLPQPGPPSDQDVILAERKTLHSCKSDFDCIGNQKCYNAGHSEGNFSPCNPTDTECSCVNLDDILCMTSTNCLADQRCVIINSTKLCVACNLSLSKSITSVDKGNCGSDSPMFQVVSLISAFSTKLKSSPTNTIRVFRTESTTKEVLISSISSITNRYADDGFTLDLCSTDSDCVSPRMCIFVPPNESNENIRSCQLSDAVCRCFSFKHLECKRSFDCLLGDRCLAFKEKKVCLACRYIENGNYTAVDEGDCDALISPVASIEPTPSDSEDLSVDWSSPQPTISEVISTDWPSLRPTKSAEPSADWKTPLPTMSAEPSADWNIQPTMSAEPSAYNLEGDGFTFDKCSTNSDCVAPRLCLFDSEAVGDVRPCRTTDTKCWCISTAYYLCESSSDCLPGDRCFQYEKLKSCLTCRLAQIPTFRPVDEGNCDTSIPPSPSQTPSGFSSVLPEISSNAGDSENACIALDALKGYASSSLVFATHKRTNVLCDNYGSCATAGHMVIYKHVAMSMSSYCGMTGISCVRQIKLVNSPRMKLGLRIESKSKDLVFTALSASRGTRLEERFLKMVILVGV